MEPKKTPSFFLGDQQRTYRLKKALKSKKVFELTAAINAAEELDKTLYEEVRMSASFYIPALKNNSLLNNLRHLY